MKSLSSSGRRSPLLYLCLAAWVGLTLSCEDEAEEPSLAISAGSPRFVEVTEKAGLASNHRWLPESMGEAEGLAELLTLVGGAALGDVDGDHNDDVLLLGGDNGARFYFNAGDGTFDDATEMVELQLDHFSTAPLLVDVDADQDPDLIVANVLTGGVDLWRNVEGERFEKVDGAFGELGAFAPATGLAVADVDFDGDLDVFVSRWNVFRDDESRAGLLWVNDGDGEFSDGSEAITSALGSLGCQKLTGAYFSPSFANLSNGRDLVLARPNGASVILVNTTTSGASPSFVRATLTRDTEGRNSLGALVGGLYGGKQHWVQSGVGGISIDGLLGDASIALPATAYLKDGGTWVTPDTELCAPSSTREPLDAGDGGLGLPDGDEGPAPTAAGGSALSIAFHDDTHSAIVTSEPMGFVVFANTSAEAGPAIGGCYADFDNNGLFDLLQVATNHPPSDVDAGPTDSNVLGLFLTAYDERGAPQLGDHASSSDLISTKDGRSALCFDYDSDGDIDVLLVNQGGPAQLFRNDLEHPSEGNRFIGVRVEPSDNLPIPVGARVSIATNERTAFVDLQVNAGFLAQAPLQAHFGLAEDEEVLQLKVTWPDGAPTTLFTDVPANDIYRLKRTASAEQ